MKIVFHENWKDIKGYEGIYQVSDCGRVKSLKYHRGNGERLLKLEMHGLGYMRVILCKNGKRSAFSVHRLVAEAFVENPCGYDEINHKDENKGNNHFTNLEWCDRKYNCNYGTSRERQREKVKKAVLQYDKNGIFIKEWNSVTEAGKCLGNASLISACCKGKKASAYGFIWKYRCA